MDRLAMGLDWRLPNGTGMDPRPQLASDPCLADELSDFVQRPSAVRARDEMYSDGYLVFRRP